MSCRRLASLTPQAGAAFYLATLKNFDQLWSGPVAFDVYDVVIGGATGSDRCDKSIAANARSVFVRGVCQKAEVASGPSVEAPHAFFDGFISRSRAALQQCDESIIVLTRRRAGRKQSHGNQYC